MFGELPKLGTKRCEIVTNSGFAKTAYKMVEGINKDYHISFELYSTLSTKLEQDKVLFFFGRT
jgi:hypothetical protein